MYAKFSSHGCQIINAQELVNMASMSPRHLAVTYINHKKTLTFIVDASLSFYGGEDSFLLSTQRH